MDLQAWRERQASGEMFELPSGLVVRLRRVGMLDLAQQGRIPAPLVSMVEGLLQRGTSLSLSNLGEYSGVVDLVVAAAIVDPPMAEQADDTHLAVGELPMADRLAAFNWCNAPALRLRPFRPESADAVDSP